MWHVVWGEAVFSQSVSGTLSQTQHVSEGMSLSLVSFYEPTYRQTSRTGLTRLPKQHSGRKWLWRRETCTVVPPSGRRNQTWRLWQSMNYLLHGQSRLGDLGDSLVCRPNVTAGELEDNVNLSAWLNCKEAENMQHCIFTLQQILNMHWWRYFVEGLRGVKRVFMLT